MDKRGDQPVDSALLSAKSKAQMSYHHLIENEGHQIYAMKKLGHGQKEIAELLGRSPSAISRELRRNYQEWHCWTA